jgi:hypothetical protein
LSNKKNDIKCCACGKKLAEAQITNGWVNIRCKCGANNLITVTPEKKEERQAGPEKREYPKGTPHY